MSLRPLAALFLLACQGSGSVAVADAPAESDADTDADSDADTDADSDADTDADTDPDWSGEWTGDARIDVWWDAYNDGDSCRAPTTLVVQGNGNVTGELNCYLDYVGIEVEIWLDGQSDPVGGNAHIELNGGFREADMDWSGAFTEQSMTGSIEGTMTAYDEDMDLTVDFELER